MTKNTNPFFKYGKEDLKPTCKRTIGLKLPKSLFCNVEICDKDTERVCKNGGCKANIIGSDFYRHFSQKDSSLINMSDVTLLRNQEILEQILVNYLNSQCLERKYFNIDVVIAKYKYGFVYLGCRDDYYIHRENLVEEYNLSRRIENSDYFVSSKYLTINDLLDLADNNFFTIKNFPSERYTEEDINSDAMDSAKIVSHLNYTRDDALLMFILDKLEHDLYDKIVEEGIDKFPPFDNHHIVQFRLNNFLDEFIDGVYKSNYGNNIHKGLCQYDKTFIQINNKPPKEPLPMYFTYDWFFDNNMNVVITSVKSFNAEDLDDLVNNSTNDDLKNYFKKLHFVSDKILDDDKDAKIQSLINKNKELSDALVYSIARSEKEIQELKNENRLLKGKLNS